VLLPEPARVQTLESWSLARFRPVPRGFAETDPLARHM
jgi:hypothetical protein